MRAASSIRTDVPIEELIFVPKNAEYYAAYGAVMYGLHEAASVGLYRGLDPLKEFISGGRKSQLGEIPPGRRSSTDVAELEAFREEYAIPRFVPATLAPGQVVRGVIGLDGGSTSSKAVLIDEDGEIILQDTISSRRAIRSPDTKELLAKIRAFVDGPGRDARGASASARPATPPTCSRSRSAPTSTSSRRSRT